MKTLALDDGDLVLATTGYETVSGSAKVKQELICDFLEPLGNDRFHPDWGSLFPAYVGQPLTDAMEMLVLNEANRVLQNYITIQQSEIIADVSSGSASRFDTSDVVRGVESLTVNVNYSSIFIYVQLTTLAGDSITLTSEVSL